MSLLDDARQLKDRLPCNPKCCDQDGRPCPHHTLVKIVAALEAAEHAIQVMHDDARHYEVSTSTHAAVEQIEKAMDA